MPFVYEYPRPAVTVDIILFSGTNRRNARVLLIERKNPPFQGYRAFPGGFLDQDEPLHSAAVRELYEETNIKCPELLQFRAFGDPGRDPRHHTVTVVFYGFVQKENQHIQANSDASSVGWYPVTKLPPLAFDHEMILNLAVEEILTDQE